MTTSFSTPVSFPTTGTPEFDQWNANARDGKIDFGPRENGGNLIWDFNKTPHGLIAGHAGAGKSVALNVIASAALHNPDSIDLVVCDPKATSNDFSWAQELPNVIKIAVDDADIANAIAYAIDEMGKRQAVLSQVGVRNIGELRQKLTETPELVEEYGEAPKRLILMIDELPSFLADSSDKDIKKLKDEARSNLEIIARLGRAMEVNIVTAAQKLDSTIVSAQLRSQLGFRLGVGPLDRHESEMILNSDHGTRHEAPIKGRAWGYDPIDGHQLCQVYALTSVN